MKAIKSLSYLCLMLIVFPDILTAAPIYLKCEMATISTSEFGTEMDKLTGSKNEFSVKLDESTGKITHTSRGKTVTNANQFNSEGFFAATSISYKNKYYLDSESVMTDSYEIDRSNLNVLMSSQLTVPGLSINVLKKSGTCTVEKIKENKI